MTSRTQQHRSEVTNTPPPNGSLLPGELYVELADPVKLWAGVPVSVNPAQVKLLYDSTSAGVALNKTGDRATGLIHFDAGIDVTSTPANVPLAPQDTNTLQAASTSFVLGQADTAAPLVDGTAAPGSRTRWSRGDHVHPTDTSRAPVNSPTFTGTPLITTTPPQDDNTLKVADTAYVIGQAGTLTPLMDGSATPGTSLRYARADHVHPPDTTRGTVTVSDVPPASPNPGSFWFDSVGVQLYLYYNDGNSTQWVPVNNQALAGFLALTGGIMQGPITMSGPAPAVNQVPTLGQAVAFNTGRNLADNALFNVQQRGAGPWTANGNYTADRYELVLNLDSDSVSVIALTDAQRSQIGDESAQYGLQNSFTGNAGAAAYSMVVHKTEKVRRLSGKTITVSFWAASPSNLQLGVYPQQSFGTGGSPSAALQLAPQTFSLSSTFSRYQATFNLPFVAGKTLGTNGDDQTNIYFAYSAGSANSAALGVGVQSGTITLWGIQVEIGSQATPLEKPNPQQDLARCQRFYLTAFMAIDAAASAGGQIIGYLHPFPVQMRAAPTITANFTGQTNCTGASSPSNLSALGWHPYLNSTAAGQCYVSGSFTASADL